MKNSNFMKVEKPENLDRIFSLDCFKFNEMKELFVTIFGHLSKFGDKIEDLESSYKEIPNFDQIKEQL